LLACHFDPNPLHKGLVRAPGCSRVQAVTTDAIRGA
jgi:hypothetical protein